MTLPRLIIKRLAVAAVVCLLFVLVLLTTAWAQTGLRWQGNWASGTSYSTNDAVFFGGSSYVSLVDNNMSNPGSSSPVAIPHTLWSVVYVDSQETTCENGAAANAIDSNSNTKWVTQWCPTSAPMPHEIQINLGASYNLTAFSYLPRQDGCANGWIKQYEFYVSADGTNWGAPVASGSFNYGNLSPTCPTTAGVPAAITVAFPATTGHYIRLRALSEINGNPWTAAADIGALQNSSPASWSLLAQQGATGATGTAGTNGTNGLNGAPGAVGATGPQGPAGATGAVGAIGPIGPVGPMGPAGPAGTNGTNGAGFNWSGPWSSTTSYNVGDVASFGGTSYVATTANTGQRPDTSSNLNFTINWPSGPFILTFQVPATSGFGYRPPNGGEGLLSYNGIPAMLNGSPVTITDRGCNCALEFLIGSSPAHPVDLGVSLNGGSSNTAFDGPDLVAYSGSGNPVWVMGTTAVTEYYSGTPASINIQYAPNPNWNVLAQAGAPGAAGATGPQGPAGAAGAVGPAGPQGLQGAASTVPGPQGPAGPTGPAGSPPNTYVNTTYSHAVIDVSQGISSPGVIALNNIPAGSYLVTGTVTLFYGIDPAGHRFVNPWCDLYASDGAGSLMNMGQAALTTIELPFTADNQTTASATLVVNGWVTFAQSTNLIYVGCSINGPWNPTTLYSPTQTITAVRSTIVKSAGSVY